MTVNSNTAMSPASLIAAAFKCDEVVASKSTTGIQTMAAAIFAHHAEKGSQRQASFSALSEKGEAFNLFKSEIVAAHISPRMKTADGKADVVAQANTRNSTQMVLLNKGLDLAFALHSVGVSNASFVPGVAGGVFHVPVSALVANDDTALGALAMAVKNDKRIALDGKTYAYESDGKFSNLKAFPARVLEIAGYKKPGKHTNAAVTVATVLNGASDTTTTGSASAVEIRSNPATWSLDALLSGAADLLNRASDIVTVDTAVSWSGLDEKTRNAIEAILIFRDECRAVDATQVAVAA